MQERQEPEQLAFDDDVRGIYLLSRAYLYKKMTAKAYVSTLSLVVAAMEQRIHGEKEGKAGTND